MHEADAAQTFGGTASSGQFGNEDGGGVPHDDHVHLALPVDGQADLTAQRARQRRQFPCLFDGIAAEYGIPPLPKASGWASGPPYCLPVA